MSSTSKVRLRSRPLTARANLNRLRRKAKLAARRADEAKAEAVIAEANAQTAQANVLKLLQEVRSHFLTAG